MTKAVTVTEPHVVDQATADSLTGRDDPQQRFRVYRLCECFDCMGKGKMPDPEGLTTKRCPECRGEGKVLDLVATCADPQSLGVAIVQLGQEGEFNECPIGVLDTQGEKDQKWIILPWLPSPRNVSDAARTLARSRKGE